MLWKCYTHSNIYLSETEINISNIQRNRRNGVYWKSHLHTNISNNFPTFPQEKRQENQQRKLQRIGMAAAAPPPTTQIYYVDKSYLPYWKLTQSFVRIYKSSFRAIRHNFDVKMTAIKMFASALPFYCASFPNIFLVYHHHFYFIWLSAIAAVCK